MKKNTLATEEAHKVFWRRLTLVYRLQWASVISVAVSIVVCQVIIGETILKIDPPPRED